MTEHDDDRVTVVVRNGEDWHVGRSVDNEAALTLIGVVSEAPASWEDMAVCWARYRTPPVAEFLDGLPMKIRSEEAARDAIHSTDAWVFLDLDQKRLLTGPEYPEIGRREVLAMQVDEDGTTRYPVMVNLAPWWELHEQGHLKLAFLLTEIVSVLQSRNVGSEVLGELNDRFTAFRHCPEEELHGVGRRLGDYLESLTDRYPEITSRVADFCSRIDEHICKVRSGENDIDG